jgi:PhnB protein
MTSIQPELAVRRGREAVAFYVAAFDATVVHLAGGTDAEPAVVAQLTAGDATFWVSDEAPDAGQHSPESLGGGTVRLLLVVDDPREVVASAAAHGASVTAEVHEEHGWLLGRIVDPFGHHWEIGHPRTSDPTAGRGRGVSRRAARS